MARSKLLVASGVVLLSASMSATPPQGKVDLCHRQGNGRYTPISVDDHAAPAHVARGAAQRPNGTVPGDGAFVFDSACNVVSWQYAVNAPPDAAAFDPASPGNLFIGSGIPAQNFGTARNQNAGIELGMMVLYRQGPTITTADDYTDGVLHFTVNDGPQSIANGSFANNATRAAWNFTFSIATGLDGATTSLGDYTFQLLYDVDPGPAASYRTLTLEPEPLPAVPGQSGFQWRDQGTGLVFVSDDEGNVNVTQNSENYAFGFFQNFLTSAYGPANAFAGPAQFDIILQALDGAQIVVRNHVVVNVAS